jgi:hypothetical protein
MKNVSEKVVEKIKTHILCSVNSFSENDAVQEIMWKNMVQPDRSQIEIWYSQTDHRLKYDTARQITD